MDARTHMHTHIHTWLVLAAALSCLGVGRRAEPRVCSSGSVIWPGKGSTSRSLRLRNCRTARFSSSRTPCSSSKLTSDFVGSCVTSTCSLGSTTLITKMAWRLRFFRLNGFSASVEQRYREAKDAAGWVTNDTTTRFDVSKHPQSCRHTNTHRERERQTHRHTHTHTHKHKH